MLIITSPSHDEWKSYGGGGRITVQKYNWSRFAGYSREQWRELVGEPEA